DQEALGTQQACRRLPPRLGLRVVNQPVALPGQLRCRGRHIRYLELDARLRDWDVIGPVGRPEARHGCLPERPQAEVLGTWKSFRELVVALASLKRQPERALVEVTRRHVVTNYRREACEELHVHRPPPVVDGVPSECMTLRSRQRVCDHLVSPPVAPTLHVFTRILAETGRTEDEDLEALRPAFVASPRAGRYTHHVPLLDLD